MITQEQLDKISDEFKSTFTLVKPNVIANCMYPEEITLVNEIINKHTGLNNNKFIKLDEVAPEYYIYQIELK